jgi:IclR family transcriptional regulator, KDG regulon repressor
MSSSLTRGLMTLDLLVAEGRPLRLTDIAQALSISKSGLHSLLATLVECGYVEHLPGGIYQLGFKSWQVGKAFPTAELVSVATSLMEALVAEIREGAILGILSGFEVSYVHLFESNQVVRVNAEVGDRIPPHCTSTGLALLAFQDDAYLDRTIPKKLKGLTPQTITDPKELRAELKRVRARGYSINRGGWDVDVGGIAAPIITGRGTAIAAVCVAVPLYRMNQEWIRRVAPALTGTTAKIGAALSAPALSKQTG